MTCSCNSGVVRNTVAMDHLHLITSLYNARHSPWNRCELFQAKLTLCLISLSSSRQGIGDLLHAACSTAQHSICLDLTTGHHLHLSAKALLRQADVVPKKKKTKPSAFREGVLEKRHTVKNPSTRQLEIHNFRAESLDRQSAIERGLGNFVPGHLGCSAAVPKLQWVAAARWAPARRRSRCGPRASWDALGSHPWRENRHDCGSLLHLGQKMSEVHFELQGGATVIPRLPRSICWWRSPRLVPNEHRHRKGYGAVPDAFSQTNG